MIILSVFEEAARNVMIKMMLADEIIDPVEKEKIREIYYQLTKKEYPPDALDRDIERVKNENYTISDYVRQANNLLTFEGKMSLLTAVIRISAADNTIKGSEKKLLKSLAMQLGIPYQEVRKTIDLIRKETDLEEEVDEAGDSEDNRENWICSWCGKENEGADLFCKKCNQENRLAKLT